MSVVENRWIIITHAVSQSQRCNMHIRSYKYNYITTCYLYRRGALRKKNLLSRKQRKLIGQELR